MKILQVVHRFPPRSRGGTEICTYNLSKELSKNNEIYVVYPLKNIKANKYALNKFDSDGLHIVEILDNQSAFFWKLTSRNLNRHYGNSITEKKFKALLNEINPDIVHFQHLINLSASLIKIVKRRGIPMVITLHDFWFMCPRTVLLKNDYSICSGPDERGEKCYRCWHKAQAENISEYFKKLSLPKGSFKIFKLALLTMNKRNKFKRRTEYLKSLLLEADMIITASRFLRSVFIEYGIPERKIIHSNHGYNFRLFEGFEKRENDRLVFGFMGGLAEHKGLRILVEAFNRVDSKNAELRIYANYDPHSNYYKKLKSSIVNDSIKFVGAFHDVRKPFSEIDILVVPSIFYETGGPLVVLEALISKTPVIASNIGCIPEFIKDYENGLLFEAGSSNDLYSKIRMLIEKPSLIDNLLATISPPRSIEDQAKELERLYTHLKQGKIISATGNWSVSGGVMRRG